MDTVQEYSLKVGQEFLDHFIRRSDKDGICGEVVMVIPRPGREILVMTKAFYPDGVYRLPSGGMRCDEEPQQALTRELLEETGFNLNVELFLGKMDYLLRSGDQELTFVSHIYLMQPTEQEPQCSDTDEQITGFRYVSPSELRSIADDLRNLPDRWQDWGRFRAISHDYIAERLKKN